MKNIKFLLFIICLVFFLNVIFFNCSFATLYILKNQEGNDIWLTNNESLVSKYEKLGYVIWILKTVGSSKKSLEPKLIDSEPQTKVALPPTTKPIPAPTTNINRDKMIDIFKANALKEWGNDSRMVNYEVNKQTEAYDWVIKQTKYPKIMNKAKQEWADDYAMVKYEYEKQLEAYNWINQQKTYPKIMNKAKQEWADDYAMVKYEYERQVEAYEWLQKNKNRNPEAFNRASNKWGNDYVMVKYEYEKEI